MPSPISRRLSRAAFPVAGVSLLRWRYVAMLMLLLGGGLIEFGLVAGLISTPTPLLVQTGALTFVILAAVTATVTPRHYETFTRLVVLVTIIEITLLAAACEGIVTVPVFYVWPLLAAAYLLTRIDVCVFAGVSVAGCSLSASSPELGVADYVSVAVMSLMITATARLLAENLGTTIQSLRTASRTDPLTGLLNRRAMTFHVDRELRGNDAVTVLMLDIDHFKRINDRLGHAVGDAALVRFADLLAGACRGTDRIARMGGEEFAVLMPCSSSADGLERATVFSHALRADRSIESVHMTVSVGVASSDRNLTNSDQLLQIADDAVYEAKRRGRDRIVVAPTGAGRARDEQRGQCAAPS